MTDRARLAVFASGGGTNLQALLDHFNARGSPSARVELVVASRAGIGAIERASAAGVPAVVLESGVGDEASEMLRLLGAAAIDLIVLAGFLKLVPPEVVERYEGRMINIHPALLPSHGGPGMYGMRVHRAVIAAGARVSGATVHLVGTRYDEGPILAQWPVPVLPDDTPEALASRVLRVEHILLPMAIERLLHPGRARNDPAEGIPEASFELVVGAAPPPETVRRLNG